MFRRTRKRKTVMCTLPFTWKLCVLLTRVNFEKVIVAKEIPLKVSTLSLFLGYNQGRK